MAETLFQEGKSLMEQGSYQAACPKLAQSSELDLAGGTVLLLAVCYEKAGKPASAWVKFNEALGLARRDGRDDRVQRAQERLRELTPRLSRAAFQVPPAVQGLPDLKFVLDGTPLPVPSSSWSLPVDPGTHSLTVSARDHQPWSTTFTVAGEAQTVELTIPNLQTETKPARLAAPPASGAPAAATALPVRDQTAVPSPWRTVGFGVGALGLASMAVGSYFGVSALSQMSKARDRCDQHDCSDRAGVSSSQDAASSARVADFLVGGGLLAVGVGAVLILTGRPQTPPATALVAMPAPGGGAVGAIGRF